MCLHCLYGIYIYTTEVFTHAIKKRHLVYLDFGIFENDLIYIEMLHRDCWLDSVWVRSPGIPFV